MNEFNYCNYIGEHMDEPLEVMNTRGSVEYLFAVTAWNIQLDDTPEFTGVTFDHDFEDCKPIIKSISDLTDEEWIYIALGKKPSTKIKVVRDGIYVRIFESTITMMHFHIGLENNLTQDQWNRLYSLHCHINTEELIKNGLAVRKE